MVERGKSRERWRVEREAGKKEKGRGDWQGGGEKRSEEGRKE